MKLLRRREDAKEPNTIEASCIHLGQIAEGDSMGRPGVRVDIGAPRSVLGQKELNRILSQVGRHSIPISKSKRRYRFADAVYSSLGTVEIPLETPNGIPLMSVGLDIVSADVPALLDLDILDSESLFADTMTNRLVKRVVTSEPDEPLRYVDEWSVPLTRFDHHVYAKMSFPRSIFCSRAQLNKLHRRFAHPAATRLYNLLRPFPARRDLGRKLRVC